jgi:integrase
MVKAFLMNDFTFGAYLARAMLATLLYYGLRRTELCALHLVDVWEIVVRATLVLEKRNPVILTQSSFSGDTTPQLLHELRYHCLPFFVLNVGTGGDFRDFVEIRQAVFY